ncbi:MAG: hypothetical protein M1819_005364 [Sarea resinae]|nr:MAG: hypothetical protein M1819_005364 [Sarea resinae]
MASSRNPNTQPTYDFLTGAPSSPLPLRETVRQSQIAKPGQANEDLRAQVKTLQYELETIKQERELASLRHEKELRDVQRQAEADFKRAQASESSNHVTAARYETLANELRETQDQSINDRRELEKKLRAIEDQNRTLQEELDEAQTELSSQERQNKHRLDEQQTRYSALQKVTEELQDDLDSKVTALQVTQQKLVQREADAGHLESEVLRLKAQTGDTDTLGVIKRELSEQVAHIKKLESTNRDQLAELKHYRKQHKSVEVVEEEKRVLEQKVHMMDDLRRELSEAQLQRQILEDERKTWTSYLQNEKSANEEMEFDSPVDLARALVHERLTKASLMDKLGSREAEVSEKDEFIIALENEKSKLQGEIEKLRTGATPSDTRAKIRLERQRALAVTEVEYLRAQLKTFDAEETTFQPDSFDEQKSRRITELEDIVDQYRKELQSLNDELAKREESVPPTETTGSKRPREEDADERLGLLSRKNRKLQDEISSLNQTTALLRKELEVHKSQLSSLQSSSRHRILELRTNPTAEAAAIKMSALIALRTENAALLAQLEGKSPSGTKVVPISTLENARMDLRDMEKTVADKEKRMMRLKQIWGAKSLEFREAVASVLGWKMDFMPNGRVRVTSMFYAGADADSDDDGSGENSIIFDGENGTMKISGGPNGAFALEIRNLIKFWVEERKEIPCFLAAMTLEFYEKTTRAARM